jgi:hypothetical protein
MRGGPRIPIPDFKLQVIAAIRKLLILAVFSSERVARGIAKFGILTSRLAIPNHVCALQYSIGIGDPLIENLQ